MPFGFGRKRENSSQSSNGDMFQVTIPSHARPGQTFEVQTPNGTVIQVVCPANSSPGQNLQINVPGASSQASFSSHGSGSNTRSTETQQYMVTVPPGVVGGQQFPVSIAGQQMMVVCPHNLRPGEQIQFTPPPSSRPSSAIPDTIAPRRSHTRQVSELGTGSSSSIEAGFELTSYVVTVPRGVRSGQQFYVTVNGEQLEVTCPAGAREGERIRINVPVPTFPPIQMLHAPSRRVSDLSTSLRSSQGSVESQYRVTVPTGVSGGQRFAVTINGEQIMVTCPPTAFAGEQILVKVPQASSLDQISESDDLSESAMYVVVPPNVTPGENFTALVNGEEVMVRCPPNAEPGSRVRISLPPFAEKERRSDEQDENENGKLFEVDVPSNVQPGQSFTLLANGVRVQVKCPPSAGPGHRIRFRLPRVLTEQRPRSDAAVDVQLQYNRDGWSRTIRLSDMQFQWMRVDEKGEIEDTNKISADKSAYVRHLKIKEGTESLKFREGELSLVPASEALVDSKVKGRNQRPIVTYSDIAEAQVKGFDEKNVWFKSKCNLIRTDFLKGYMRINVRRGVLVEDAMSAVMSMEREDLVKVWKFNFLGEEGIDAGGLAREFFELVSKALFDPDMGLWKFSASNQMCLEINPDVATLQDDYERYYRFIGRILGKALLDGQLIKGHMIQFIYKHILGWPITLHDLRNIDEEYYENLKKTSDYAEQGGDVSDLCLDFTTSSSSFGQVKTVELVEGGKDKEVTNKNLSEYIQACLQYRVVNQVKSQLTEVLLGFYDVVPEPLLTVFDFQELELMMCGLPNIDMDDWKKHTVYAGLFPMEGDCRQCRWFWDVVSDFDHEMRARLLQFVTATSGVPAGGFGLLQGNDGNIRYFTLLGISSETAAYPRAHTCFNRLDLPLYDTKEELETKLREAIISCATGFEME